MESVIIAAILLSILNVGETKTIKLYQGPINSYRCTPRSPTDDDAWFFKRTKNEPPVALTHVFCGEIKGAKAQGFHSRYLAKQTHPQCARTTGKIFQNYDQVTEDNIDRWCTFEAEGIEVLSNPATNTYTKKTTNQGQLNKFFPDNWTPQDVVDIALKIYHVCGRSGGSEICIKNYRSDKCPNDVFSIMIFTDDKRNIISVFPTEEKSCACDYKKVKDKFDNYRPPRNEL